MTPFGPRSGLIEWVEGAVPLFTLYKRWQFREASQAQQIHGTAPVVPRPSELFFGKLHAQLEARGIRDRGDARDRSKWPVNALKDVLKELKAETPSDLLQKELWCVTTSPAEWWFLTENLCRSIAVMSSVGYIIGLGDRHLDNVLLDLHKGEIVHIDYNVCFEKGRNLKVPERVPFRLTQNIQTAMGLTGIEGTFRLTCEQVLTILRKERETLLTLLEAFVYDPLVDWTPLQEAGVPGVIGHQVLLAIYGAGRMAEYRNTSYQLAVRMFVVRLKELERQWIENK